MTNYSNIAVETTLVSGIGTGDLSLTVADATGYPTAPFHIVVDPGSTTAEEVMLVSAAVGAAFTVTRAYDGTTAKVHASGATVIHAAIAKDFSGRYTSDAVDALLAAHTADTTSVHGITDTSALVLTNDARLTDARTPTGGAGGVLSGNYPNPGFAVDMATQAELDTHASDTTSVHGVTDTADLVRRASAATAGRVPFWSAGDTISHDAELTYDSTNNRLTVPAIEAPSGAMDISALGSTVDTTIEIGALATGDRNAIVDLHSNDTHTDYALRIVRAAGVNGIGQFAHRGTGALRLATSDAAAIELYTSNALRMTIASNGEFIYGGSSFPASPSTGARFFRTDLGFECYYDGTRWLTVHEYELNMTEFGAALPYGGAPPATLLLTPSRSDRSYYFNGASLYLFVDTTNNGTNYWSFQLLDDNTNVLWSFNTSADAAGQILKTTGSFGVVALANFLNLNVTTKTGTPGNITRIHLTAWYRLIIT